MNSAVSAGVSRRELMIFFYKFRRRLILAFLLPLLCAFAASTLPVPRYKAESVLVVRLGSEYVYQPEPGNTSAGTASSIPFDREQIFKSEVAILSSDDLHKEVIQSVGLKKLFPEMLNPTLFSRIKFYALGGFLSTPASRSEAEWEQYRLARAAELFDARLGIALEKESAVITIAFEHPERAVATDVLETLLKLYFEKRKNLYLDPRAELAESQMNVLYEKSLKAQKAVEEFKLEHKIYSLEDQRKQLLDKRNDAQRRATSITSRSLDGEIANLGKQLDDLDRQEREFNGLQKEAQLATDAYSLSSHRYSEAKSYEEVQRDRASAVRIIQPPSAPPEPRKIRSLILLAGVAISLLITLLTAAISEFTRRGFLTPEEAERQLKLPVLAVIPHSANT